MSQMFTGIDALTERLSYQAKRHAVLSSNIANAQTPGYRPQDLSFDQALGKAQRLTRTDAQHLNASGLTEPCEVFDDTAVEPGNDGNAVSMERQMAKLAANSIRFNALAEMVSRRMAIIRYAAGER